MLKIMRDKWGKNKELLRKELKTRTDLNDVGYKDIVKLTFDKIFNPGTDELFKIDIEKITEIDDGGYCGTLLYLIPLSRYEPAEYDYLMTYVGYGSCGECDVLKRIQYDEQERFQERLCETQVSSFMALCSHIICNTIKPYNYGWRYNDDYKVIEEMTELENEE